MQPERDLAIVLRTIPYEDRHRIVTALTLNYGVISAIAKNSIQSRRFGGTLELFSASEWSFTAKPGAELFQLTEAQIREPFENLRKDFLKLSTASVFTELMLKFASHQGSCPELFRLHSNALAALNEPPQVSTSSSQDIEIVLLNAYFIKLLQYNGNLPQLNQCLQCNLFVDQLDLSSELSCIIPLAGWTCPNCRSQSTKYLQYQTETQQPISQSLLRITPLGIYDLQISLNFPIRQVLSQRRAPTSEHRTLFRFLEALFTYHVPGFDQKPLKSLRFLSLELQSNSQPLTKIQR